MTQTAIQVRENDEYTGLTMVVSPAEARKRVQELQAFVADVMVKTIDYGVIPGTGDKPTLLQPGAQKLAEIYGFAWDFEDAGTIEDWDKPLFVYKKKCVITSRRGGFFVCSGLGSCNSREDRYAYRWVYERDVPKGVDKATLRVKEFNGRNGAFKKYRFPNEDICGLANTIEKMACKRALVGAVIGATRSSGLFTQDVEDLPQEAFGQAEESRSWQSGKVTDAEYEPANKAEDDRVPALIAAYEKAENQEDVEAILERAMGQHKERNFSNTDRTRLTKAKVDAMDRVRAAA